MFNQALMEKIRRRVNSWVDDSIIGDVFLDASTEMRIYTHYVNNYNRGTGHASGPPWPGDARGAIHAALPWAQRAAGICVDTCSTRNATRVPRAREFPERARRNQGADGKTEPRAH